MAGLLVRTGHEGQAILVPGQTPHPSPPFWSRITPSHGRGWGTRFGVRGAELARWFHQETDPGARSTDLFPMVRCPVTIAALLLFCPFIGYFPVHRWSGMLRCILSGPVLSLWCLKANRSLMGSLLGKALGGHLCVWGGHCGCALGSSSFWGVGSGLLPPSAWVSSGPLEVLTCNILSYRSCQNLCGVSCLWCYYECCYSHFSDAQNATWWVSERAEPGPAPLTLPYCACEHLFHLSPCRGSSKSVCVSVCLCIWEEWEIVDEGWIWSCNVREVHK